MFDEFTLVIPFLLTRKSVVLIKRRSKVLVLKGSEGGLEAFRTVGLHRSARGERGASLPRDGDQH